MTVAEIMTREIVSVRMDDSVDAAKRLFDLHRFHHLLVVDGDRLVGVVSDRDILRAVSPFVGKMMEREQDTATLRKRVHQIMTRKPVTVTPDETIDAGVRSILEHRVSCLPVVDAERRPIGIVTWRDLLGALSQEAGTP